MKNQNLFSPCKLCPRNCGADRKYKKGFCRSGIYPIVARADLHMWEEPCITGKNGSGAVFFSGCNLGCVFCQNYQISHNGTGEEITDRKLADIFLMLKEKGAENINLVNPVHFTPNIINALDIVKDKLGIPVIWNSGGYEKKETIRLLSGYIDIFLPDLKYITPELSEKYSGARDYFKAASEAIDEMLALAGYPVFDNEGKMIKGVLVRHLILPSHLRETKLIIDYLSNTYDKSKFWISLMSQYVPFYKAFAYPEISRKLTTLESQRAAEYAGEKGLIHGFCQDISAAGDKYVPEFFNKLPF